MFSGIVERQGTLVRKRQERRQMTLTFEADGWEKPLKRGESIAVNGVCLTVAVKPAGKRFTVNAVRETLAQTTIGSLRIGDRVNLERSLKWGERIGGHFVLGHVDGVGRVIQRRKRARNLTLTIDVPPQVGPLLVSKGSIAVDGVSLTIQKLLTNQVTIAIIPLTARRTTIGRKRIGDRVNLEADVIAKHLAKWVKGEKGGSHDE